MKKKLEFSKFICGLILAVSGVTSIYTILKYFQLVEYAIASGAPIIPDGTVPVAAITVIVSAFVSYCMYQFGLKNSRNKYGVDETGQPYKSSIDYYEAESESENDCSSNPINHSQIDEVISELEDLHYVPTDRGGEEI